MRERPRVRENDGGSDKPRGSGSRPAASRPALPAETPLGPARDAGRTGQGGAGWGVAGGGEAGSVAVLQCQHQEQGAQLKGPDPERQNDVGWGEHLHVEAVGVVPPVVERRRRDHRERAPDAHPGAERAAEAPERHARVALFRRGGERCPQHQPAARQAREHAPQVDRHVGRGPERVAADRAMPGDVPDHAHLRAGRRDDRRGDIPGPARGDRRGADRRAAGWDRGAAHSSYDRSREPPATRPLPRHFSKIFFTCWWASARASFAVMRPVAALANMVGRTKVSNTSLSAGLAGPGCPMFVAQSRAVLIGLSLDGGVEPNGSFAVTCSSRLLADAAFWASGVPGSATEPGNDGKLYSLLPRTASR